MNTHPNTARRLAVVLLLIGLTGCVVSDGRVQEQIASEVASLCGPYMDAEAILLDYLKGDNLTPKGLAAAQTACKAAIDKLGQQVSRR